MALAASLALAQHAGIKPEAVVLDPGYGFGKRFGENFSLLKRQAELLSLGSSAARGDFAKVIPRAYAGGFAWRLAGARGCARKRQPRRNGRRHSAWRFHRARTHGAPCGRSGAHRGCNPRRRMKRRIHARYAKCDRIAPSIRLAWFAHTRTDLCFSPNQVHAGTGCIFLRRAFDAHLRFSAAGPANCSLPGRFRDSRDGRCERRAQQASTSPADLVIKNATVMTASHGTIEHGSVWVHAGKIAGVGATVNAPVSAAVMDATGMWLTPGIIDPAFALRPGQRCQRGHQPGYSVDAHDRRFR